MVLVIRNSRTNAIPTNGANDESIVTIARPGSLQAVYDSGNASFPEERQYPTQYNGCVY